MKSGMADPFPPALSLTPKGTGGGYGVGTDLDALMVDAHENIDVYVFKNCSYKIWDNK